MSFSNQRLLILDGHGSHVTLEAIGKRVWVKHDHIAITRIATIKCVLF